MTVIVGSACGTYCCPTNIFTIQIHLQSGNTITASMNGSDVVPGLRINGCALLEIRTTSLPNIKIHLVILEHQDVFLIRIGSPFSNKAHPARTGHFFEPGTDSHHACAGQGLIIRNAYIIILPIKAEGVILGIK